MPCAQGRRLREATKQLIHVRRLTTLLNSAVQTEMRQAKQQRFNRVTSLEERLREARSARASGAWPEGGSTGASSTAAVEQEAGRVAAAAVRSVISRALFDVSSSRAAAMDAREGAPSLADRAAPPRFPGHLPVTGFAGAQSNGAPAAPPDEPLLSPLAVQPGEWWLSAVCCGPRPKLPPASRGPTAFDLPLLASLLHAYAVPARTKGGVPRGRQVSRPAVAVS